MTKTSPQPTPKALPRVLVVDDLLGDPSKEALRQQFCKALSLKDNDDSRIRSDVGSTDFLAEVTFESGQSRSREGVVSNDLLKVIQAIRGGWPFADGSRWALVCIDLHFAVGRDDNLTSEPFGADILKAIEETGAWKVQGGRTALGRATEIPVIMLSGSKPAEVERMVGRDTNVAFIQKWAPEDDAKERTNEFGRVMFKESLVEDGALRYVSGNVVRPIPRNVDDVKRARGGLRREGIVAENLILGSSVEILSALRSARATLMRGRDARLLVMADRGAGKELFVKYLHDHRPIAQEYLGLDSTRGNLIQLNLQEVAEGLREDALTGHRRGAYTGADRDTASVFKKAGTGTLHLDEIGNLKSGTLQMLLRLVENRTFQSHSSDRAEEILCQIVLTTNKDIPAAVRKKRFPADLYDRLDKIILPPLRDREGDAVRLFELFVESAIDRLGCCPKAIDSEARARVRKHKWEGNIRELQRVAELVVTNREYSVEIGKAHINLAINQTGGELQRQWAGEFEELLVALNEYRFPSHEVDSAWIKLELAMGNVAEHLLEVAMKEARNTPDRRRVECVNRVLKRFRDPPGKERFESGECARKLINLQEEYGATGSTISELLKGYKKNTDL